MKVISDQDRVRKPISPKNDFAGHLHTNAVQKKYGHRIEKILLERTSPTLYRSLFVCFFFDSQNRQCHDDHTLLDGKWPRHA